MISNIANYLKHNYIWDGDGIDNVTLRLWKFSDFCSRHTVGVAGDDIMFHILFINDIVENIGFNIRLFADDTTLFIYFHDEATGTNMINSDLLAIKRWADK